MRLPSENVSDQWSSTATQTWQRQISTRLQLVSLIYHVLILASLTSFNSAAAPRSPAAGKRSTFAATAHIPSLILHVNKTCLAHTCNDTLNEHHLRQVERNIDRNVNACDDFHRYACANWKPPSAHNNSASMLQVAEEQLTARYVELFERALNSGHAHWHNVELSLTAAKNRAAQRQQIRRARTDNKRSATTKTQSHSTRKSNKLLGTAGNEVVRTSAHTSEMEREDYNLVFLKLLQYYHVCTQAEQLTLLGYYEHLRFEGLLQLRHHHWQQMLANFARFGYGEQFVFYRVYQQNASQHDLNVLPHDTYKRANLTAEIYDILRAHTHLSRAELTAEFRALENDVEAIVLSACAANIEKYENKTVLITAINIDEDCDFSEIFTFAELTARCSDVDWQRFIGMPLGRHLHAHDLIRVHSFEAVCKLARYHNQAQHAEINFIYTLARFLQYLQEQQHNPVHLGSSTDTCIRHMRKTLSVAMTYVYDRTYYAPVRAESDNVVHEIFAKLKAEFARTLSRNRMQFDADIVAYLQQKLRTIRLNLGNLPPKVNSSFYVDLIWKLNVSNGNFYSNHLNALAHAYGHLYRLASSASRNHSRSAWYTFNYHHPTFNDSLEWTPYYFCLSNIIVVPHAYLQLPFYDRQLWLSVLYGDLANTLGHELIHSFDTEFLLYDHVGNMNELMLDRITTNVNFARNIQCLNQTTKFLSERICDVSGTRLAINTFMRDSSFRQSNRRLFFLQFAQFFCSRADEALHQLLDPWHDADTIRLNYTLAQMPEFLEAFNCPARSPMGTVQRCELW